MDVPLRLGPPPPPCVAYLISESQYNSNLGRNEIVRENSRRWEAELSIRQPLILFGYPTNGYLSLNNRIYRYAQLDEQGERDITYYNRYFVRYTQPLFQPNSLRNSLEEAALDLEVEEIEFYGDMVDLIDDAADDFYDLFEETFERIASQDYVEHLVRAEDLAQTRAEADPDRALDVEQVRVELANAREPGGDRPRARQTLCDGPDLEHAPAGDLLSRG